MLKSGTIGQFQVAARRVGGGSLEHICRAAAENRGTVEEQVAVGIQRSVTALAGTVHYQRSSRKSCDTVRINAIAFSIDGNITTAHVDCSIDNLKGSAATTGHTTLRGLAGTCSSVLRLAVLGVTTGHCRRLSHVLVALVLSVVLLLSSA